MTVVAIWESAMPRVEQRDGFRIVRVSRRAFGVDALARIRERAGATSTDARDTAGGSRFSIRRAFAIGTMV
ncbi:MAG: hypothetical protein E6G68_04255, partial [Actinobacteria bacterium]